MRSNFVLTKFSLSRVLSASLLLLVAGTATAHGPQIQTTLDNGKIVTRNVVPDGAYDTTLTPATSVYVMPLGLYQGVWRATPDSSVDLTGTRNFVGWPGFAYGYGYDATTNPAPFPLASRFTLGFTAGLKSWDGAAFVDAGVTEAQIYRGSSAAPSALATTTDAGPFQSVQFPGTAGISYASEGADTHNTVNYRLMGDGVSLASPLADGVYLMSLQLSSSSTAVTASDPFYFVLSKNPTQGAIAAAVASLGVNPAQVQVYAVPEPAGIALAGLSLIGVGLGARRRSPGAPS